jgi:hypothetical protein
MSAPGYAQPALAFKPVAYYCQCVLVARFLCVLFCMALLSLDVVKMWSVTWDHRLDGAVHGLDARLTQMARSSSGTSSVAPMMVAAPPHVTHGPHSLTAARSSERSETIMACAAGGFQVEVRNSAASPSHHVSGMQLGTFEASRRRWGRTSATLVRVLRPRL